MFRNILRSWWFWGALYLATATVTGWGFSHARRYALANLDTAAAQGEWSEWRKDARLQSGEEGQIVQGPVQRRVPKSSEPPMLVLMRDYFWQSALSSSVAGTALFFFMAFVSRGLAKPKDSTEHG